MPITREELNEMNANDAFNRAYDKSPAGQAAIRANAEEKRAKSVKVPALYKESLAFEPIMLKSALFRPGSGARVTYVAPTAIRTHGGCQVTYTGEELRQDDLRVLMLLIKMNAGKDIDKKILLGARAFCRTLGWADSGGSVSKLDGCLQRMTGARVSVEYSYKMAGTYTFIQSVERTSEWRGVLLSRELAKIFQNSSATWVNQEHRFGMKDGLASWLLGYVKADACYAPFSLADLREIAGLTGYKQKDFNAQLRGALDVLKFSGCIDDWSFEQKDGVKRLSVIK